MIPIQKTTAKKLLSLNLINAQSENCPSSSQHPGTLLKHPPSPEHSNQTEDTTTNFYDSNYFFTILNNQSINQLCSHCKNV